MNTVKHLHIALIFLINISVSFAQVPNAVQFSSPLDIPLVLSGTFGELRGNHFHTGIDIKTKGVVGLNVRSVENGFISRINISPYGYGKALYITHPNGYTTVYAHLNEFSKRVEEYIKSRQYKKKNYSINEFPDKSKFVIKKNDIIAKTGNTGGSGGPHLHFEIRETKTEKPQNPFNFGIKVKDSRKPIIKGVFIYSFDKELGIQKCYKKVELEKNKESVYEDHEYADSVTVPSGWVSLGVNAYDRLDFADNKNGVYSVRMEVDSSPYFEYKMNSLEFSKQRYINSFIDYSHYIGEREKVQKLFKDPGNKLSMYDINVNNGYFLVEEGKTHDVKIIVEDYSGNNSVINLKIHGVLPMKKSKYVDEVLTYSKENVIETSLFKLDIPKGALYNDASFYYSYKNEVFSIGNTSVPLQKRCVLDLKIENSIDSLRSKMYIAVVSKNGGEYPVGGKVSDNYISIRTRNFGNYKVLYDTISPVIDLKNIHDNARLDKDKYIVLKIKDNESGVKSYEGFIDGNWMLFEYNYKTRTLRYNLSDIKLKGDKHSFEFRLEDNVGNISTSKIFFYRKS